MQRYPPLDVTRAFAAALMVLTHHGIWSTARTASLKHGLPPDLLRKAWRVCPDRFGKVARLPVAPD